MAITDYCRLCACQVTPAQVKNCSSEECPLRVRPVKPLFTGRKCPVHTCGLTDDVDCGAEHCPGRPYVTGAEIDARFNDGTKAFVDECNALIERHMDKARERMARILREMAERMSPEKDAGE